MPRASEPLLPEYLPHDVPAPKFEIKSEPGMFGGLTARALVGAGESIEKGSQIFGAVALEKQNLENETFANSQAVDITDTQAKTYENFASKKGQAAALGIDDYKKELEKNYEDALAKAPNEKVKAMISRQARYVTDQYIRSGTTYAAAQGRVWATEAAEAKRGKFANEALIHSEDPEAMENFLSESDEAVRQKLAAEYTQPGKEITKEAQDVIDEAVKKNRGANYLAIIKQKQDDPDQGPIEAAKFFQKHKDEMDTGSQVTAMNGLRVGLNQVAGQEKADIVMNRSASNLADRMAAEEGVDPTWLKKAVKIESGGRAHEVSKGGNYFGYGQLSWDEFHKHGGTGDIFDPEQNMRATARKLKFEIDQFTAEHGRPPEFIDWYMIHQQGKGGYEAHMRNPDGLAWQNMLSTAEGRQKGEAWAKKAIWWNVPDDMKKRFGSVDNITSRQFVSMWAAKAAGMAGNFLPDKTEAFEQIVKATEGSPQQRETALAWMNRVYSIYENKKTADDAAFATKLKDSTAEALNTGQVKDPISKDEFFQHYEMDEAERKWQEYEENRQYGSDVKSLMGMTKEAQLNLLDQRKPQPGDPFFEKRQKHYDDLKDAYDKITTQRQTDPAGSVKDDQFVQYAERLARDGQPSTYHALVTARIAAQRQAGIPEDQIAPLTHDEAVQLTVPMTRMLPGEERQVMGRLQQQFANLFQEDAPAAWAYAMRVAGMHAESGKAAMNIFKKLSKGETPTREEAATVDEKAEQAAAAKLPSGWYSDNTTKIGDKFFKVVGGELVEVAPPPVDQQSQAPKANENIPSDAIKALMANPKLADEFNRKYGVEGKNVAKEILERYRLAPQAAGAR